MKLDLHTIMLTVGGIHLMFGVLMAFVGQQIDKAKGARHWAVAELCIGLSYIAAAHLDDRWPGWQVLVTAMIAGVGFGSLYTGIEAFTGRRCRYWIPAGVAWVLLAQNLVLVSLYHNPKWRLVANSLVVAVVHAACVRALLLHGEPSLRPAFRLAAAAFFTIAAILFGRALTLSLVPAGFDIAQTMTYRSIQPLVLIFVSMAQLLVGFSLIWLLHCRYAHELRELASIDPLTGALNRRSFEREALRLLARAERSGELLAVIMLDVDFFKLINDRHGHLAGDEVLRRLAALCQTVIRNGDYLIRYGGEEFCILLPATDEAGAVLLAERLRKLYADLRVAWQGEVLHGTLSVGVADSQQTGGDLPALVAAADQALYRAKRAGRNCTARYSDGAPTAPSFCVA